MGTDEFATPSGLLPTLVSEMGAEIDVGEVSSNQIGNREPSVRESHTIGIVMQRYWREKENLGTTLNTQCVGSLNMRAAVLAIVATALTIFR